jgi:ankyrin repeat protein
MRTFITLAFAFIVSFTAFSQENLDSALLEASYSDNKEQILELLRKGANINTKTTDGVTPLMYATQNNSWELVKILIYNGADINSAPADGRVALISAVMNNNLDIADYLALKGAKLNVKDYYSISPLLYAAAYDYYYISDMVLYYGADVNIRSNDGTTPLIIASFNGNTKIDSLLIAKGADINKVDTFGFSPLMAACQEGNTGTTDFLLKKGANTSILNKYGNDALSLAVLNNHNDIAELLLKYKTDTSKINDRKLLYKYAYVNNNQDIIRILRKHKIRPGILPVYSSIHYGITNLFSHQDDMLGGILGIYDCKYKTSLDFSFYTRLGSKRVLVESTPLLSYQYWERRSLLALTLQKNFLLSLKDKTSHWLFIGIRETYTYGKYRASTNKPEKKFILVPQLGYALTGKIASLKLNYEYLDLKTYQLLPHRLNLELLININTFHLSKQSKTISSWLKKS